MPNPAALPYGPHSNQHQDVAGCSLKWKVILWCQDLASVPLDITRPAGSVDWDLKDVAEVRAVSD